MAIKYSKGGSIRPGLLMLDLFISILDLLEYVCDSVQVAKRGFSGGR
jgi:hypothetical protein